MIESYFIGTLDHRTKQELSEAAKDLHIIASEFECIVIVRKTN